MRVFSVPDIESALTGLLQHFDVVQSRLDMRREALTGEMVEHLVSAYRYLNEMLQKGMDVFTPVGMYGMLELNHLVLCGDDPRVRTDYYSHLTATRQRFLKRIHPIRKWVLKQQNRGRDPYEVATGLYSRVLSYPQLFLEGNHRTGNILLNYVLVSAGESPYIATAEDAHVYLNLSGDFKLTERDNTFDTALKMPGFRKEFQRFLRDYGSSGFVTDVE